MNRSSRRVVPAVVAVLCLLAGACGGAAPRDVDATGEVSDADHDRDDGAGRDVEVGGADGDEGEDPEGSGSDDAARTTPGDDGPGMVDASEVADDPTTPAPAVTPAASPEPMPTATAAPNPTVAATTTPVITSTPAPSATPDSTPTATPAPPPEPTPTASPTPTPTPTPTSSPTPSVTPTSPPAPTQVVPRAGTWEVRNGVSQADCGISTFDIPVTDPITVDISVAGGGTTITVSGSDEVTDLTFTRQSVSSSEARYSSPVTFQSPEISAASLTVSLVFDSPTRAVGTISGYVVAQGVACTVANPLGAVHIG